MPADGLKGSLTPAQRKLLELRLRGLGLQAQEQTVRPRADRSAPVPLSFSQQRLWFLQQMEPESSQYNIARTVRVRGRLDVDALGRALSAILARHESLRTTFVTVDGRPEQVINEATEVALARVELSDLEASEREDEARSVAASEAARPFDLERSPLLRATLIRLDDDDHVLVIVIHHIVADGWSMGVLVREVSTLYDAFARGGASPLPEPSIQYADFAAWQRGWLTGDVLETQVAYWRNHLAGLAPVLELPADHPRPAVKTARGEWHSFSLGPDVLAGLSAVSSAHNASLFMTALAAFQVLLARYSGQSDIPVGTPIVGRTHPELEDLIGFFVNTLVLRTDLSGDPSFNEVVGRVREVALGAYAHQDAPFEKLVEELQPARSLSYTPLFQVMFSLDATPDDEIALGEASVTHFPIGFTPSKFDLQLTLRRSEEELLGVFDYDADMFEPDTIARMESHFANLLRAMCANPDAPLSSLDMLAEPERHHLTAGLNDTAADYPSEHCLHELFEAQVAKTPDAVALVFEDQALTYKELDERANRLAHHLVSLGAGPGTLVGICLERSLDLVTGLLAILKAGGAYVPLDPDYPRERVSFMLEDAGCKVVITTSALAGLIGDEATLVLVDEHRDAIAAHPATKPETETTADDVAYVIYTSGSTGTPKGVAVGHRGVANRLAWMQAQYPIGTKDAVLQKTPFSFDVSVWEFFWTLQTGARLVMARPGGHKDPAYLQELIEREGVSVIHFVPSMLAAYLAGAPEGPHPRLTFCSGEALPAELARAFKERFEGELHNLYGPTEASVDVTFYCCTGEEETTVPIGRPIANTQIYLLDAYSNPVPIGVPGELYIGGVNLAHGYLNRASLTAERFVPDPFATTPGQKLYRTGDLARYLPDGNIEFLGRADHQVKIRGFRIEPGEIEAALVAHDAITDAVVIARSDGGGADTRLVAYVVSSDGGAPTITELRAHLLETLPEHMVPSAFVTLDAFPLTPNGKLDRKALPAPEGRPELEAAYIAPRTATEEILAAIWAEILGVERVGIEDNFFELGGDSILSLQIIARAAKQGLRLTPKQLFQHQTVAALAAVAGTRPAVVAEQGAVTGELPLTPIQRWFFELDLPERHHFNQSMLVTADGVVPDLVSKALRALVDHHDALRLRYTPADGGWAQTNARAEDGDLFTVVDLSGLDVAAQDRALVDETGRLQRSLDLERGPLARSALFDLGPRGARLFICVHHLAIDGVSWRILLEDLETAYAQLASGKPVALPAKTTSFKQWAERLAAYARTEEAAAEAERWMSEAEVAFELPRDHELGPNDFASTATVTVTLDESETAALLREVPAAYRTQINDVLLAALAETLGRWTGRERVLIDLEGHGREELFDDVDVTRTVGWFTSLFPVALDVRAGDEGALLKGIKEQLRAVPNRGLGYGVLRYLAAPEMRERVAVRAPVIFNYLGRFGQETGRRTFGPASEDVASDLAAAGERAHDVDVNGMIRDGRLQVSWSYSRNLHERASIERVAADFVDSLRALVAHCTEPGTGGVTPSDFPLARVEQPALDELWAEGLIGHDTEDVYPLTPMQQGMVFHTLYEPDSPIYFEQFVMTLEGALDPDALRRAWQQTSARHAVLRSSVLWEGLNEPVQVVRRDAEVPFERHDLSAYPVEEREAALVELLAADRARGFDLAVAPLQRVTLVRLDERRHALVWSHHHLLLDGWSTAIVRAEILGRYNALVRGESPAVTPARPYRDYIEWLEAQDVAAAEAYWRETLAGFASATPLLEDGDTGEAGHLRHPVALDPEVAGALWSLTRRERVTLNTVVQGAWALLLSRYSGEEDVVFGATVAGRPADLPGVQEMVGLFINTVPVRVAVDGSESTEKWLGRLQADGIARFQFEHSALSDIQSWSEVPGGTSLFDTIVVFENYPSAGGDGAQSEIAVTEVEAFERTNYALNLIAAPGPDIPLLIDYDRSRFHADTIARMGDHLANLLGAIAAAPDAPLSELDMLAEPERRHVVAELNDTATGYPEDACVHELFAARAEESPDAVAVTYRGDELTYGELNEAANRLAHHLVALGVGPETLVGICLERGLDLVVGMVAILKAGGAYVPLDPDYPRERLAFMLEDTGAPVLVTSSDLVATLPDNAAEVVLVDGDRDAIAARPGTAPAHSSGPGDLAYVIYTSGSTGRPKGVAVEHGAITPLVRNATYISLTPAHRVAQASNSSFDALTFELWGSLTSGATLVVCDEDTLLSPPLFGEFLRRERVTTLFVTTALFNQIVADDASALGGLEHLLFGGEACDPKRVRHLLETTSIAGLRHVYGPTETTTFATWCPVDESVVTRTVPIGRPLSNMTAYVLDRHANPVPVGVAGELYIGGAGLARGYLNRASLTADRFVPDPFSGTPGARLYRTGDRVRRRIEGDIEFLGRVDDQVKIRGFRIEPGEIEAVLVRHEALEDAVVMAREDTPGDRRLVAYVVSSNGGAPTTTDLRAHLLETLPDYMVPSAFLALEALPLTPNGKLDRAALPAPEGRPELEAAYVAPRTPTEETLAGIWSEVLGLERVGVHDNFFELGGDSILSIQIIARAAKQGLRLTPKQLFQHQSVAALAGVAGTHAAVRAEQGAVTGELPLTPIQRWFFDLDLPERHHFNQSVLVTADDVDPGLVAQALRALVDHHDVLRLRYTSSPQGWTQTNAPVEDNDFFSRVDLSELDADAQDRALLQATAELQAGLDLTDGPLLKACHLDLGPRGARLFVCIHHLAVDGVSWRILLEDLETAYAQLAAGDPVALPPKTTSFKQWAERLAGYAVTEEATAELDYWAGVSEVAFELPRDHERGPNDFASAASVTVALDEAGTEALLREVPAAYRTQINDVLLAALADALARFTGRHRVLIDLEGHGREELFDDLDLTRTVGWFTSMFPVALDVARGDRGALLKGVKEQLRAVPNRGLGYGVLRYLGDDDVRARLGVDAPVSFNYLGRFGQESDARTFGPASEEVGLDVALAGERVHDVDVNGAIREGVLKLTWTYSRNLHEPATIAALAEDFMASLRALIAHCMEPGAGGVTPSDFPLAELEQATLDELWAEGSIGRETEDVYPLTSMQQGMAFHTMYEPGSGVYFEQQTMTLEGKLDARSLQAAWQQTSARHAVLNSAVLSEGLRAPVQVVRRNVEVPFEHHDLSALPPEEQDAALSELLAVDRARGFELDTPPLQRVALVRMSDDRHVVVWSFHHLLLDGWSMPIVIGELFSRYHALVRGDALDVAPSRPYRDYVAWLHGRDATADESYWRAQLAGFGAPTPLEIGSTGAAHNDGGYAEVRFELDEETSGALESLARGGRMTLNTVVQGAWALLLSRYSGERDVVFGATVSGRPPELTGVEEMVGLFINTVPVRVEVAGDAPSGEWLASLQDRAVQQRAYEHAPLTDIQAWSEVPPGTALFESLVVFENYPVTGPEGDGGPGELELSGSNAVEQTNYPLSVVVTPGDRLSIILCYDRSRFRRDAVARMSTHLVNLLSAVATSPNAPLSDLEMLTEPERRHLTLELNLTAGEPADDRCVHELLADRVGETPDAVAVVYEADWLSYRELDQAANRLAHHLVSLGVGPEVPVGVCLGRGTDLVVALLAAFKAGGVYLPLDPDYPAERLSFMLADTGASVVVTTSELAGRVDLGGAELVLVDADRDVIAARPDGYVDAGVTGDDAAYVIYTSGSTGTPKGVVVSHRSLADHCTVMAAHYELGPSDRVLVFGSFNFDVSLEQTLAPLVAGACAVVGAGSRWDPDALVAEVESSALTMLNPPTAYWHQLAGDPQVVQRLCAAPSLRLVAAGGEAMSPQRLRQWLEAGGDAVALLNNYGPTEATITATSHRVNGSAVDTVPIGRPVAHTTAYVLDSHGNPVPLGVPGELLLGGSGVARGYVNRPSLTAERFLPDPFSSAPGARLYRTGDRARYLDDGSIEFLGRVDDQVKIRGFRIEPGEIEAALVGHESVRDAAVVALGDDSDKRLVAYVVSEAGDGPGAADLRSQLLETLPDHMVPAHFVALEALPLTPNGKVDRAALPAPEAGPESEAAYVAPRTPTEEILAGIWGYVLGLERVGTHDNFFELGGHSLVATQVVARVRAGLGVELPLRALFESPTVAALAAAVAASDEHPEAPPITPVDRDRELPLSFAQQRLWFLDQLEPDSAEYNVPQALRVRGPLQRAALERALSELVARHEPLRTTFVTSEAHPVQVIAAPSPLRCELVDLTSLAPNERESEAGRIAAREAARPFDLARGPLLRATLIALDEDDHVLVLVMHHIVSDAWSLRVFTRELTALYDAFSHGYESPLAELPLSYADYAAWQRDWLRGDVLEGQLRYWRDQLAGLAPVLELPTDRPRPAVRSGRGATHAFALDAGSLEALNALSRAHNATLFMTLLSAFKLLLARYSGQTDIAVGTPIAGRTHAELEDLIGFFVNTLVLRTDLSGDPSFADLLTRVRDVALGAYARQDVPFEKLVDELRPVRSLRHTPLFQVMFTLEGATASELALGDATVTDFPSEFTPAKFDLHLALRSSPDALEGVFLYDAELFDPGTVARLGDHLINLLHAVAADPGTPLSELDMLAEPERHHLTVGLNDTAVAYPEDAAVHELFAAQAARAPGAVALAFGKKELTYEELNAAANRLAHHLADLGVGPDTLVGICLERSLDLVVGLLAILKAGAAYVPLDPDYPSERLAFMLEDTGVEVLLTHSKLRDRLPAGGASVLVDVDRDVIATRPATDPERTSGADDLAYVMYTSGSTGMPKGVAVPHRGIVRLVCNTDYVDITPDDVFLQFAPISFDASTFEIWAPLLNGARVALADPDELTLARLGELLERYGVTVLWLTASLFNVMIEAHPPVLAGIRQLLAGGDALSPGHVAEARAALPGTRLINGYGPTESTTFTCCYPIGDVSDDASSVPIGRPIANTTVYLLDAYMNPVPLGVPGELYIGGAGLARGYLNQPALTAERFVPDPFSAAPGGRLYRTGDRARFLRDGNVEFLGRVDHQVKIRGFRIEPGEIEAALLRHEAIRDAVVMARRDGDAGDKRLVAYVVASGDGPTTTELRSFLLESLPDYMVPSAFVVLDAFPLTPNGKVDRAALPAPEGRPELDVAYVAPRSPGEEVLAEIWCEVLDVERVGVHDDFFELGGNSLIATQVVARLQDGLGIKVGVRSVFEASTIDALAAVVEEIILEELDAAAESEAAGAPSDLPGRDDRAGVV